MQDLLTFWGQEVVVNKKVIAASIAVWIDNRGGLSISKFYSALYSALRHATIMYTLHSFMPLWCILCIVLCNPSCHHDVYSALYSAFCHTIMMYTLHYTLHSILLPLWYSALRPATVMNTLHYTLQSLLVPWCILCIILCTPSWHHNVYSALYSALCHGTIMYTLHYTLQSVVIF